MNNLGTNEHQIYLGDCIQVMDELIKRGIKVDAIICDLPYQMTNNKWDKLIPYELMWDKIAKIKKDAFTPVLLFADDPFSAHLQISNEKWYRYKWFWNKKIGTGFLDSAWKPLKIIEQILVFIEKPFETKPSLETWKKKDRIARYYPQFSKGEPNHSSGSTLKNVNNNYGKFKSQNEIKQIIANSNTDSLSLSLSLQK